MIQGFKNRRIQGFKNSKIQYSMFDIHYSLFKKNVQYLKQPICFWPARRTTMAGGARPA